MKPFNNFPCGPVNFPHGHLQFTRADYFALEDAKVWVKSLLMWDTYSVSLNMSFPVSKYDRPRHHSNTVVWTVFKSTFYAICVISKFYFHWGNRTLSVWDSKLFRHKFRKPLAARVLLLTIFFTEPEHFFPSPSSRTILITEQNKKMSKSPSKTT